MELDFTKLNSLAFMGFTEIPPEKQPSKTPLELELEEVQGYRSQQAGDGDSGQPTTDRESYTGTRR